MNTFSHDYDFEEVKLAGDAVMAWGTATLTSNGYPGEFFVSKIVLSNGAVLLESGARHRCDTTDMTTDDRIHLFKMIASKLEGDISVKGDYADAEREANQPDPDRACDERRDHEAMGWV